MIEIEVTPTSQETYLVLLSKNKMLVDYTEHNTPKAAHDHALLLADSLTQHPEYLNDC